MMGLVLDTLSTGFLEDIPSARITWAVFYNPGAQKLGLRIDLELPAESKPEE